MLGFSNCIKAINLPLMGSGCNYASTVNCFSGRGLACARPARLSLRTAGAISRHNPG